VLLTQAELTLIRDSPMCRITKYRHVFLDCAVVTDMIQSCIIIAVFLRAREAYPPFTFSSDRADADGSGYVTLMDATYIRRWLTNLPSNNKIGKVI